MNITTVGIDLAKTMFQIHAVDERGKAMLRKQPKRSQILAFFVNLPSCLIGMEACGGAHFWARKLSELGHTVKLMAPQFVKPYVKTNKHDAADAEAICEAGSRPNMRFVPIKNAEQQALLGLHRARQGFVQARTAQVNQIRGLLSEFGIVMAQGIRCVTKRMPEILKDVESGLSGVSRELFSRLFEHFRAVRKMLHSSRGPLSSIDQAPDSPSAIDPKIPRLRLVDSEPVAKQRWARTNSRDRRRGRSEPCEPRHQRAFGSLHVIRTPYTKSQRHS